VTAFRQFLTELRRRRVIRVLILYAIAGWVIVQIASTVLPSLHVPEWSVTLVVVLVALGLPLAAILAWAFDVGDGGIKRAGAADAEASAAATPAPTVTTPPSPLRGAGPATPPAAATAEQPDSARARSPAASSTREDGARRSIAVLPFANLTGDSGKDYLGDGLAEELIHTLARVPGLRVPSRTSSFAYRGREVDLRRIANELEVSAVLEGSVRAAGERVRITAQLIDGNSGYHLWSQHYDRRSEDLFELQDELASAIILQTLNVTLEGPDRRRLLRDPPTRNLEAYRLYLEAMSEQARGSVRSAFDKLQLALRLDPGFAQARAAVVQLRSLAIFLSVALPGTLADAEREARDALAGAPDSAAIHAALGVIHATQARWLEAEASFQQALMLDEGDPWAWSGHGVFVLSTVGHLRAYLSSSLEAHRLAPAWLPAHIPLTAAHLYVGNDDEARAHGQAAIELGAPRNRFPLSDMLSRVEVRAGRHDAARALMQEACRATMGVSREIEAVDRVYGALAGTTDRATAIASLDGLRNEHGATGLHNFMLRRLLHWYSVLGAYDQAYQVVNRLLDDFAATGTIGVAWGFLWQRELAGFREDARFATLAARMRLPDYWQRYGPPDGYDWRDGRLVAR
jgi:adenylate cyclase